MHWQEITGMLLLCEASIIYEGLLIAHLVIMWEVFTVIGMSLIANKEQIA